MLPSYVQGLTLRSTDLTRLGSLYVIDLVLLDTFSLLGLVCYLVLTCFLGSLVDTFFYSIFSVLSYLESFILTGYVLSLERAFNLVTL